LAEGGEVTHYEVLDELAKEVKDKKFASEVYLGRRKATSSALHTACKGK
jgi:hypothetical protein